MRALLARPFYSYDSRRVSLRYLSAVGRYTAASTGTTPYTMSVCNSVPSRPPPIALATSWCRIHAPSIRDQRFSAPGATADLALMREPGTRILTPSMPETGLVPPPPWGTVAIPRRARAPEHPWPWSPSRPRTRC